MTVAVVVVPADAQEALADSAGRAAVRRIVDSAWAGGALPIVVVADDPDATIAAALGGSPALLVAGAHGPGGNGGPAAWRAGLSAAADAVRETSAVLLWPGRMTWVDPETVTSLIEAHGGRAGRTIRPTHDGLPGWPVLVPIERAEALVAGAAGDLGDLGDVVAAQPDIVSLDLGDPGSVRGREVAMDALPPYEAPAGPVTGAPPEWGAAAAEEPDMEGDGSP